MDRALFAVDDDREGGPLDGRDEQRRLDHEIATLAGLHSEQQRAEMLQQVGPGGVVFVARHGGAAVRREPDHVAAPPQGHLAVTAGLNLAADGDGMTSGEPFPVSVALANPDIAGYVRDGPGGRPAGPRTLRKCHAQTGNDQRRRAEHANQPGNAAMTAKHSRSSHCTNSSSRSSV